MQQARNASMWLAEEGVLPNGMAGVNVDITERKQAEDALRESEARVRQLMEMVPIPLGVLNKNGEIIFFNERFIQVFGYTQTDLPTLEAWWQRAYPDAAYRRWVKESWEAKMRRAAETNTETEPMEFNVTCKDGTVRVVVISNIMIEDNILATFVDITERKRAAEALRESRERLDLALISSRMATFDWDIVNNKRLWSDGVHSLLGTQPETFTGTTEEFFQIMPPEDRSAVQAALARAVETNGIYETEYRAIWPDGSIHHIAARGKVHRDHAGQAVLLTGVCWDITERKVAEEAVNKANEQLREADCHKDEFLAMLAHELRNPLAPVRNAVAVLQYTGLTDPRLQRQSDIINRQVTHMARLLDDLLDVSRITRGKIVLQMQPLHLSDVLANAVETATPLVQARNHTLHVTEPPDELLVEGDPDRLAQVVGNLLMNALKYTNQGGEIWLEAKREDDQAIIRVRDNGMGIEPELLPRVFDLFAQADRTLGHAQGGLGIGLTMVHSLVQMHGGTVEARSAGLGYGSEFIVRLPALPEIKKLPARLAAPEKQGRTHQPRRILVVDDVVDTAESLAELLGLWGHAVHKVHDGLAAIEMVRQFRPEVVLLDIGMPGMDGFEVARCLRREHPNHPMMLVALTGYAQESDREDAQEAGFDAHLSKPVNLEALRELLEQPAAGSS